MNIKRMVVVAVALTASALGGAVTSAGLSANASSTDCASWYATVGEFQKVVTRFVPDTDYAMVHTRTVYLELRRCADGSRTWQRTYSKWSEPFPNPGYSPA